MNPAIVVSAYNRAHSLNRLLRYLQNAHYPPGVEVPLVISIDDAPAHPEVDAIARYFDWPYGPKEVLARQDHLGLVQHFYACGDLTEKYGSIIYLEDDLIVSPVFYTYAAQTLEYYCRDPRIAGISFYGLWFNGYNRLPFIPTPDDSDVFFLQVPYTQGEAFTYKQWADLRFWQADPEKQTELLPPFHENWARFPQDEWFPGLARYMVSADRFFVFPRISHVSGTGEAGTHFARDSGFFQVPLQQEKLAYRLKSLDDSISVYDSFFEILPSRLDRQVDLFLSYPYSVDFYATKSRGNIRTEYILTSRPCRNPLFSFGKSMWPLEANVIHRIPGAEISFCRTTDLEWGWLADLRAEESNRYYFNRGHPPGLRSWLRGKLAGLLNSFLN